MRDALRTRRLKNTKLVRSVDEAVEILKDFRDYKRERIVVVHMTPVFEAFAIQIVAIGSMGTVNFEMHDVFREAIKMDTKLMLLSHNHPYEKEIRVSSADNRLTEDLVGGGKCLKIPVLDHLVLTKSDVYSYRENGICFPKSTKYFVETQEEMRTNAKRTGASPFVYTLNCGGSHGNAR